MGAVALLLGACVPEFVNPVAGGPQADPGLLGSWRAIPEGTAESQIMLLDIVESNGGILVTMRDPDGAASDADLTFAGRTGTTPAGQHFASLKPLDEGSKEAETGYLLFRYEIDGDAGKVWALDTTRVAASIESGTIMGETSGSGTDTRAKVTADSDRLAAFLDSPEGRFLQMNGPGDILILTRARR